MALAWIWALNGPHQFASPIFIASIRWMSLSERRCCIKHNRATEEGLYGMARGRCEASEARCHDSAWVMTFTVVVSARFMWPTQQVHSKYLKASVLWAVLSRCNTPDLCSFLSLSLLVEIGLYDWFAHEGVLSHLHMIQSAIVCFWNAPNDNQNKRCRGESGISLRWGEVVPFTKHAGLF